MIISRHVLILAGLFVFGFAAVAGFVVHKVRTWGTLPRNRVRHLRFRLHLRRRPGRGFATGFQLWLRWGRLAAWRESGRVRPSLRAWYRLANPAGHSVYLGRAHHRRTLRVSVQEHLLVIGPPRAFKSGLLARLVTSAQGAVVSTSSKPDIFQLTSGLRERRGLVHVFNPQGIGGVPSTICWSPVEGCTDVATATRRAEAFASAVQTGGTEDSRFWDTTAAGCLRALFTAAALIGGDMRLVTRWAHGEGTSEAIRTLQLAGANALAGSLRILVGKAERTAETIRAVLSQALTFMADPQLAACTLPGEGDGFDIDEFLQAGGTLYMIAKAQAKDCSLAPVFAAIANEIQYRATQLGAQMPGGRLDPPLRMVLDEVTQICPVPLPQWLADSGGQGVQICTAFHGIAQLRERWGAYGAQSVLDTTSVRMYLAGLADDDTLRQASALCGEALHRERGQDNWTRAAVLTPAMLRELPAGWALLLRGGFSPVLARLARGWEDPEYQRARRAGADVAQLSTARMVGLTRRTRAELDADGLDDVAAARPVAARLRPVPDPEPEPDLDPVSWGRGYPEHWDRAGEGGPWPPDQPDVAEVLPPAVAAGLPVEPPVTAPAGQNGTGSGGAPAGTDAASVAAALLKLARQERELAELRGQIENLARLAGGARDGQGDGYEPIPAPHWWAIGGDDRAEAIERIASWVEHVFRPGYGHLAERLAPCWREHALCLYLLDWLSELWTVLYSAAERGYGLLASQAELQTRILPAAADQLGRETTGCDHELTSTRRFR